MEYLDWKLTGKVANLVINYNISFLFYLLFNLRVMAMKN